VEDGGGRLGHGKAHGERGGEENFHSDLDYLRWNRSGGICVDYR
jgi:hypothetical protein